MTKFKFIVTAAAAAASALTMTSTAQAASFVCTAGGSPCSFDGNTGGFSDVKRDAGATGTDTFQLNFTQLGSFDVSFTGAAKALTFVSFTFMGQTFTPVVKGSTYSFDVTKTGEYLLDVTTQNTANSAQAYSASFSFAAVPEPATWGMMIAGVGMAGASLRRRRSARVAVA